MSRKSITTSHAVLACDVCGRTLLRGEKADPFVAGGSRRLVCELCTGRAANEGWIREGADDVGVRSAGGRGRRSFLGRLRRQGDNGEPPRERPGEVRAQRPRRDDGAAVWTQEPDWGPDHHGHPADAWAGEPVPEDAGWEDPAAVAQDAPGLPAAHEHAHDDALPAEWAPEEPLPDEPAPPVGEAAHPRERRRVRRGEPAPEPPRAQRHVHAVPTNASLKLSRALEVFNQSGHPRTVAGVARSLGEPMVAAHPSGTEGSIVVIAVAWELCWYRYEVDLADEAAGVRVVAQGAELDELEPREREANVEADDRGALALA
ncbi:MAG: hypothetical protein MSC31_13580 [Solirubrobacteraceae bacterium MAG38_C4-C5]|nr:hypothetical protein [Candidatus Siliceabacter maunaloa]